MIYVESPNTARQRRENAFGRRSPFIRAVFMPGPISFMSSRGWGDASLDETENSQSPPPLLPPQSTPLKRNFATAECACVEYDEVSRTGDPLFTGPGFARLNSASRWWQMSIFQLVYFSRDGGI